VNHTTAAAMSPTQTCSGTPNHVMPLSAASPMPASLPLPVVLQAAVPPTAVLPMTVVAVPVRAGGQPLALTPATRTPPLSVSTTGTDFLSKHHLLVDPATGQVLDAASLDPIRTNLSATAANAAKKPGRSLLAASLCHIAPAIRTLLAKFLAVF
jgi:hypothetical protein